MSAPPTHPHGRRGPILPGGALLLPGGAGDRLHGPLPHPGGGGLSGGGASPLEYLAELVEANYQNYLRHSGEARFQDCFHLFFQDVKMGAVILNQDMTVLQTNKRPGDQPGVLGAVPPQPGALPPQQLPGGPQVPGGPDHDQRDQRPPHYPGGHQPDLHLPVGGHLLLHTSFLSSSAGG